MASDRLDQIVQTEMGRREFLDRAWRTTSGGLIVAGGGLVAGCGSRNPNDPPGSRYGAGISNADFGGRTLTEEEIRAQMGGYRFGEVYRHGESNPHGIEVIMPSDAHPIISDFLSTRGTDGGSRAGNKYDQHTGIDIFGPVGTPIIAAGDGIVARSESQSRAGNRIFIYHGTMDGQGIVTGYVHNDSNFVRERQEVKRGDVIGRIGRSGSEAYSIPHVHFGLFIGSRITPELIMDWRGDAFYSESDNAVLKSAVKNPHAHWHDGPGKVTLFDPSRAVEYQTNRFGLTYPVPGISTVNQFQKSA